MPKTAVRSNERLSFYELATGRIIVSFLAAAVCLLSTLFGSTFLASSAVAATPAGSTFTQDAGRLLDTRSTGGPWAANSWNPVSLNGQLGVPTSGVTALALTYTVVNAGANGYLSSVAASAPQTHGTAVIDFNHGGTISNSGITATDDNGNFQVYTAASTNVIIDLQGYFTATNGDATAGGFVPLPNGGARIANTQGPGSQTGNLSPNGTYTFSGQTTVGGYNDGVPNGAVALFANITVLPGSSGAGFVTAYAAGSPRPTASLNFVAGQATALASVVPLNSAGEYSVFVSSTKPIDILVDVQGYYTSTATMASFTPQAARVFDSRATTALANGVQTKVQVAGIGGVPSTSQTLSNEMVNVAAIQSSGGTTGYLRVWGTNQSEPTDTSDLNIYGAETRSNLVAVVPGSDDSVYVRYVGTANSSVQVVIDVEGWWTTASSATAPGAPQSVTATATNGSATVSFSAPASDGGAPVTSYTVTAAPNGQVVSSTGSPIVFSGLTNGTTYTFTVQATNAAGTGVSSAISNSVTPAAPINTPGAPLNVQAVNGSTSGTASVSFDPPASNGGAMITRYTVTSSPGGITTSGSGSPITVAGLTLQQTYSFTVTATNSAGVGSTSVPSNKITITGNGSASNLNCYSSNHCWGVDILSSETQSNLNSVKGDIGDGSYPDFIGRYLDNQADPQGNLTANEVSLYHSNHIGVEVLADETGGCADPSTGVMEADDAVRIVGKFGLSSGTPVAILLDEDESGTTKVGSCESAYADEITKKGYQPGFYLNPTNASGDAYCAAFSDPNVANAVVWPDNPQPSAYSTHRNSSPPFGPTKPSCGSGVNAFGWQYTLSGNTGSNYDTDELAPDRASTVWLP